jgi:hypothetical protein
MGELILFSIIVGVFTKGWLGKLLIFPAIISLYLTIKFYRSPKAKIIRENRKIEGRSSGKDGYAYIFAYKLLISAVVSGSTGLLMKLFN